MLSLEFSTVFYCLAGGALLCAIMSLVLMIPRLRRVSKRVVSDSENVAASVDDSAYPPVSVIVTAGDDSRSLERLLPQLLGQDYPAPMEVIVVGDGEGGPAETVVARLQNDYQNLYLTYAPANSRNLSRKKLAVTIGVKAARYDHLMLTCGNCSIGSPLWLRAMCRHFACGCGVVAGYSLPVGADTDEGVCGEVRFHAFDRVRSAVEWLAPACGGRLWRADGNNLGYARKLFYENKGFQRSLNLKYGDDDIFVREISTGVDCALELSRESMVEVVEHDLSRAHRLERIRRDFTASMLPGASRRMWAFMSWLWWGFIGLGVGACVVGLPSLIPVAAMSVVVVAMVLAAGLAWRRTMKSLNSRPLCMTVAWFITIHPLYTFAYRLLGRRERATNFTWTTEK